MGKGGNMKTYFTINKKRYEAKEFDFNLICDLQDMGVNMLDIRDIKKSSLLTVRSYVALCMDVDPELAGSEINQHVINGGDISEIMDVFQKMMSESSFFQALGQGEEEETSEKSAKKKEEDK